MPWSAFPGVEPPDPALEHVTQVLDPVLVPLGFAPGQVGTSHGRGQVIFCRGAIGSPDGGCIDLVLDVEAAPDWRIIDVRYDGLPSDRWRIDVDGDAALAEQLSDLARNLPDQVR